MHSRTMNRSFIFFLILAVGLTMSFALSTGDVSAATKVKKITLKASATKVVQDKTVKISVKKVSPKNASKAVTWKVVKGAKCVKITKKSKTTITLKALKPGTVTIKATAKKGKVSKKISIKVIAKTVQLKKFGITGYYEDGIDTINTVPLDKTLKVGVWNEASNKFEAGTTADINGNYTALYDTNANAKADKVEVVKFADGTKKWDATAAWVPGIGLNTVPNVIPDDEGLAMFGVEYRIPMGERLLTQFGLGAYSGTTDWANLKDGGYWANNYADFYHQGSTDTLTMLTGYKTELQPSGSL